MARTHEKPKREQDTTIDCYECNTEDAPANRVEGAVVKLVCGNCGENWTPPELDLAATHTSDDYFEG